MTNSFGHDFILVNDVRQYMPPPFQQNRFLHLATVVRGLKEYSAFVDEFTGNFYIEEVDPSDPNLFKRIENDREWRDIYGFLLMKGLMKPENGSFTASKEYMRQILKMQDVK